MGRWQFGGGVIRESNHAGIRKGTLKLPSMPLEPYQLHFIALKL